MVLESSTVLTSLLAFAAYLLGLSVLVQVLQEVYKHLTSSKAHAYRLVLRDLLGPLWSQVERTQGAVSLQVRGPFQLFRLRPEGRLLPLDQGALSTLLERAAPAWVQRALAHLRDEAALQSTNPGAWSPSWIAFLENLSCADKGSAGYWTAQDVRRFLENHGHPADGGSSDASSRLTAEQLLLSFRESFLPHAVTAERAFPQLESNFEYTYRRRNLRHSFLIGWAAAIALSFPVEEIWHAATRLSPDQALALAKQAQSLASRPLPDSTPAGNPAPPPTDDLADEVASLNESLRVLLAHELDREPATLQLFVGVKQALGGGVWAVLLHLLSCALTAVLLSFGAPFWNDAVGVLAQAHRKRSSGGERPPE